MMEGCLDKRNRLVTPLWSLFRMVVFNKPIESGSSIMTFMRSQDERLRKIQDIFERQLMSVMAQRHASSRARWLETGGRNGVVILDSWTEIVHVNVTWLRAQLSGEKSERCHNLYDPSTHIAIDYDRLKR
jgi:hypothetical protein